MREESSTPLVSQGDHADLVKSPREAQLLEESPEPEAEASCETQHDTIVESTEKKITPQSGILQTKEVTGDVRRICPSCGRRFIPSSLERHQRICQQVFRSSRPTFDAMKGSTVFSEDMPLRTRSSSDVLQVRASASRLQSDSRTCPNGPSVPSTPSRRPRVELAEREKSPKFSEGPSPESIEDHEQRVMHMLQQQMDELREMRRRCSEVKEDPSSLATPSRCLPSQHKDTNTATGSQLLRCSSNETPVTAEASTGLKVCEDCGRRFNPASFEKHRAVCRTVFGKTNRTPFESQTQRLRSLPVGWDASPLRDSTPCRDALYPSTGDSRASPSALPKGIVVRKTCSKAGAKSGVISPACPNVSGTAESQETSGNFGDEPSIEGANLGTGPARLTSPQRPLRTCPHCGRSFRVAAFDTHVRVCQSVFPTHDGRADHRYVYDSKRHRLKGTSFENYSHIARAQPQGDRACSSTPPMPPRVRFPPRTTASSRSPKTQMRRSVSESQIPGSFGSGGTSPPARVGQSERQENSTGDFVDEAVQVLTASDALSDLRVRLAQGVSAARQRAVSPEDSEEIKAFVEDRRGKLGRARLDMKISQRPEYSTLVGLLGTSSSEQVLRRVSDTTFENRGDSLQEHPSDTESNTVFAPPSDLSLQSQPVLSVLGSEDTLPLTTAPPPPTDAPTATSLEPSVERHGRSAEIDFRSYYERCLEHLDSIGGSQLSMSFPESVSLPAMVQNSKPGLAREDPIPEPKLGIGTAGEESFTSQPTSARSVNHGTSKLALAIAEAAAVLNLEASDHRIDQEKETFGSHSPTPLGLTPRRWSTQSLTESMVSRGVGIAPTPVKVRPAPVIHPPEASFRNNVRELVASTPVCVRPIPVVPVPSTMAFRGHEGAELPAPVSFNSTSPLTSAVPPVQTSVPAPVAYVVPQRSQCVPRLDLRKVTQAQERIRAAQAPSLQGSSVTMRQQAVR